MPAPANEAPSAARLVCSPLTLPSQPRSWASTSRPPRLAMIFSRGGGPCRALARVVRRAAIRSMRRPTPSTPRGSGPRGHRVARYGKPQSAIRRRVSDPVRVRGGLAAHLTRGQVWLPRLRVDLEEIGHFLPSNRPIFMRSTCRRRTLTIDHRGALMNADELASPPRAHSDEDAPRGTGSLWQRAVGQPSP